MSQASARTCARWRVCRNRWMPLSWRYRVKSKTQDRCRCSDATTSFQKCPVVTRASEKRCARWLVCGSRWMALSCFTVLLYRGAHSQEARFPAGAGYSAPSGGKRHVRSETLPRGARGATNLRTDPKHGTTTRKKQSDRAARPRRGKGNLEAAS